MVIRANKHADGHRRPPRRPSPPRPASTRSGFNHFFRGKDDGQPGDHVYFQGHAAPGIYARAFLEGRLDEDDLDHFRREIGRDGPVSSYPHPRLMPDFWEFPTVSMGLGPITAHLPRPLQPLPPQPPPRRHQPASRVWCFLGDGECDEPETLGALSLASREQLDNLIFVVNCNLQRLDGPVRGNGKIIQELEATFRGAGWNVIKVIWGSKWDELLAKDKDGVLLNKMNTTVDGEFQRYSVESGAYIREHFFGPDPRLRKLVEHLSDDELRWLPRGGHDYRKLYAAYKAATDNLGSGAPTAILAKTIKGWTLGPEVEGRNATHQIKKMTGHAAARAARPALPAGRDPRRRARGRRSRRTTGRPRTRSSTSTWWSAGRRSDGSLPRRTLRTRRPLDAPRRHGVRRGPGRARAARPRRPRWPSPACCGTWPATRPSASASCRSSPTRPAPSAWTPCSGSSRSTPPTARSTSRSTPTCCSPTPRPPTARSSRRASPRPGAMSSFIAAAHQLRHPRRARWCPSTSSTRCSASSGWATSSGRPPTSGPAGFLLGATAGRTTLLGEGLQHQDGHSLVLASTVPPCQAYDPAFAYEMATIVRHGIQRMYGPNPDDVFYYLTLYNENYPMPAMPERRASRASSRASTGGPRRRTGRPSTATVLFSGSAQGAARQAADELAEHYDVGVELWSATSYKALRDEALATERMEPPPPRPGARRCRSCAGCSATRRARSSPSPTS